MKLPQTVLHLEVMSRHVGYEICTSNHCKSCTSNKLQLWSFRWVFYHLQLNRETGESQNLQDAIIDALQKLDPKCYCLIVPVRLINLCLANLRCTFRQV
jgi:hypothetical protein